MAHAWVVAGVVTTTTPLVPHHHTHTHTAGLVVWAMVVLGGARVPCVCLPRHHHTRLPSHHHQRSCATTALTHTGLGACTTATHTHATCTTTHTKACCVLTTPCHTHHHPLHPPIHSHTPHGTHTRHQPHCHNGACHRSPRRPLTHTADATHTTQETDQGQAHHWLWLFVSHHHHAGLALSLSCLLRFLSTIPFSLSQACTHTPLMCSSPPCHPSRVCGVCAVGMDSTKHHSGGEARHSHAC